MDIEGLIFAFLLPVIGHVLYGLPSGPDDTDERITLHNGDGFSPADEAPNSSRMVGLRAISAVGATPLTAEGSRETGVAVDTSAVRDRPCWVVVETPPTFIELAADKFHGYLEHEGLDKVIASRKSAGHANESGREIYSKYVKIALGEAAGPPRLLTEPVGFSIEIIPSTEAALSPGSVLPVQVLVGGQPGANLQLRVSHRTPGSGEASSDSLYRTDSAGGASIAIDRTGLWRLHTISMTPSAGEAADWESLWACLTFRL